MFSSYSSDGVRVYTFDGKGAVNLLHQVTSNPSSVFKKMIVEQPDKLFLLSDHGVDCINLKTFSSSRLITTDSLRLAVSPCGKVLFVFRNYVAPAGSEKKTPNVSAIDTETKTILKEYIHPPLEGWQPQWNSDSSVCALHLDGAIHFYSNNEFGDKPMARLAVKGMRHFSLSSNPRTPSVAVYVPSQKNQPANVLLYQLRNGECTPVTNKSFYRADSVRLLWNDAGTDLLVLTSTQVSEESYYGEQGLHYLTTKQSRDSANVVMPRKGPIYQVAWQPSAAVTKTKAAAGGSSSQDLFVVCYGFMPASVTVFGTDCEPRFNFGTGSWNQLHFNPQGNHILFLRNQFIFFFNACVLSILTGDMCVWNFSQYEKLSAFKTSDVTSVSWLNDGEHLLLATTAPRMRVNNGFGIWHYSGRRLLFEKVAPRAVPRPATFDLPAATEHELYDVQVVPQRPLPPAPKPKKFDTVPGSTAEAGAKPASSGVYVPPALRNRSAVAKQAVSAAYGTGSQPANVPVGLDPQLIAKQKKKKKPQNTGDQTSSVGVPSSNPSESNAGAGTSDRAKQKSQLRKKLSQIEKLKAEKASGKELDPNQIEKLASEEKIRAQLAELSLSH